MQYPKEPSSSPQTVQLPTRPHFKALFYLKLALHRVIWRIPRLKTTLAKHK